MEDDNPLNTTPTMESPLPRIPIPPRSNDRPKLSYSGLIAMAIQNLPGQKATLNDIYDWIKDAFPYYNRSDFIVFKRPENFKISLPSFPFLENLQLFV